MHPVIINAIGCDICGAKPGEPCIDSFEGQNGHGSRMDQFRCEASLEDRLQVYRDGEEGLRKWVKRLADSNPEMHREVLAEIAEETKTGNLWLTAEEVRKYRAGDYG